MATSQHFNYDHPNSAIRRRHGFHSGGGTALDVATRFASFQKSKIVAVHATVVVAGTGTGLINSFVVRNVGTALGTLILGTSVVGTKTSLVLNTSVASMYELNVIQGTDVVGIIAGEIEYKVDWDALQTD